MEQRNVLESRGKRGLDEYDPRAVVDDDGIYEVDIHFTAEDGGLDDFKEWIERGSDEYDMIDIINDYTFADHLISGCDWEIVSQDDDEAVVHATIEPDLDDLD